MMVSAGIAMSSAASFGATRYFTGFNPIARSASSHSGRTSGGEVRSLFPEMPPMVGAALTVTMTNTPGAIAGRENYWRMYEALSQMPAPSVLVVQDVSGAPSRCALAGEVMTTMAMRLGAVGMVTDGGLRDVHGGRQVVEDRGDAAGAQLVLVAGVAVVAEPELQPAAVIVEGFPTEMGDSPEIIAEMIRAADAPDADAYVRGEAGYAARVSALSMNENLATVVIVPQPDGRTSVSLDPPSSTVPVMNNTRVVAGSRGAKPSRSLG